MTIKTDASTNLKKKNANTENIMTQHENNYFKHYLILKG